MSREHFDDECSGCRPAIVDAKTGKVMAADSPIMQRVDAVWGAASVMEKKAYHRITCLNSRAADDLTRVASLVNRIKRAVEAS